MGGSILAESHHPNKFGDNGYCDFDLPRYLT